MTAAPAPAQPVMWHEGEPPKPWRNEWFIAQTIFDDRVVLTALPESFTYDYKTADDTYIKADNIKRWMQFPDSQFSASPQAEPVAPAAMEFTNAHKALDTVDWLLAQAGYTQDSSTRHNLAIAKSCFNDAQRAMLAAPQPARAKEE